MKRRMLASVCPAAILVASTVPAHGQFMGMVNLRADFNSVISPTTAEGQFIADEDGNYSYSQDFAGGFQTGNISVSCDIHVSLTIDEPSIGALHWPLSTLNDEIPWIN